MPTSKQLTGLFGENQVVKRCACPRCKRFRTLKKLPTNFKCADVICDFCGFLAQVKTVTGDGASLPNTVIGAAWKPQKERMDAAIYFPLFLVLTEKRLNCTIHYLPADLQSPDLFKPRQPLSSQAKRAGWQGFNYDLEAVKGNLARVW